MTAREGFPVKLTCIRCPLGCMLQVVFEGAAIASVFGNQCARGIRYAEEEAVSPSRVVTGFVCVPEVMEPLSVKTDGSVPKDMVFEVARAIQDLEVHLPIRIGDTICSNVCDLGIAVVATKDLG